MQSGTDLFRVTQVRGLAAFRCKKFAKIATFFLKIELFVIAIIVFQPFSELRNELFKLWGVALIPMGALYVAMLFYWQRIDTERRNGYCTVYANQELSGAAQLSFVYIDGSSSILLARADQGMSAEGDFEYLRSVVNKNLAQGASVHLVELPKYRVPIWEWESIWAGAIQPLYETNLRHDVSPEAVEFLKSFTKAGQVLN